MRTKEMSKYDSELRKVKRICACGRRVFIGPNSGYGICDWCGRKVLGDKLKFREKMKKLLEKENEK